MAYVLSGGPIINATFTATTITDIVDSLKQNLSLANWTVNSGSSGDWTLTSASTPQSLASRIRVYNPGGGAVSARINWRNPGGTTTSTSDTYLFPNGSSWRVIANPYQFFIMHDASPTNRDFAFGGTLYVPSPCATISELVVGMSHALGDASTTANRSFRNGLTCDSINSNSALYFTLINGTPYNSTSSDTGTGTLRLLAASGTTLSDSADWTNDSARTFYGGSRYLISTPYICFGESGPSDASTINGIIYDAVILNTPFTYGTQITLDTYSWFNIAHNVNGSATDQLLPGSLFVRIA